jgi:integrase
MTALAPALQAYFTERLITQRSSSPETIAAYRDALRLLLRFAQERTGKQPFELDIDDLDAPLIGAFLEHLKEDRGNSPRTRNARLGAIHSFYRFAALEHPEHAHTIGRVTAIPTKRYERNKVSYLDRDEIAALLAAPDKRTWLGRRDHALLALMIQTGVRVSELTGLRVGDLHLGSGSHIRVLGKGRKRARHDPDRRDRQGPARVDQRTPRPARRAAVPNPARRAAKPLHSRRDRCQVHRHRSRQLPVASGQARHPAHAAAHQRDAAPGQGRGHRDDRAVARAREHPDHHIYEHADPKLNEQAIARTAPLGAKPGRYRPSDELLAFLEAL